MVRLQKIIYEQVVNGFGPRVRTISSASKWNQNNPLFEKLIKLNSFLSGAIGKLIFPVFKSLFVFNEKWNLDAYKYRGMSRIDMEPFTCTQLRRDSFFEHIQREGFHPYNVVLRKRKLQRWEKLNSGLNGCRAPQWLNQQNNKVTTRQSMKTYIEYKNYVYDNYLSDQTPSIGFWKVGLLIPIEFVIFKGIFNPDIWDRYFFNEVNKNKPKLSQADYDRLKLNPLGHDLTTADGRKDYQALLKELQTKIPGFIVPEGQQIDFNQLYSEKGIALQK